jgi:DNA repair exonuclease SbcCD ATPase subunit
MEENSQEHQNDMTQQANRDRWAEIRAQVNRPLVAAFVTLLAVLALTAEYGMHQRAMVRDLNAQSATTAQTVAQLQSQVNALNAQIQGMTQATQAQTAAQAQPATTTDETAPDVPSNAAVATVTPAPAAPAAKPAPAKHHAAKRTTAADKRYAEMQAQLTEQQKELQDTQAQVEKYHTDLEGNISSTRDELSGAIAKNHDELVTLEKKGERNYYEFELTKSKQFERVGPLSLSLRKADSKHKSYDLSMIVDDNELNKKKVNLYEPVTIHTDNDVQPVQIVVNRIGKDLVHGYVSAPKYRPAELTPASASNATPMASTTTPYSHDNGASNTQHPQ